ncbi:MAG: phosphomannomutase/phosphoglucomutase [Clostridia bacterium]|nr:phosphomannomutase/phosphoglucomutase [Clostridia bacterium]
MLNDFWKQFKSGTDIRGVAVEGAGYEVNLTDSTVTAMVNGFIVWLSDKKGKPSDELKISVGRDSRISGPHILDLSVQAMLKAGIEVIDCDLASTPSMFKTTVEMNCDGALQITASHHPYYRNGLKFFTREGGLEGEDIESILEHAQNGDIPAEAKGGKHIDSDFMSRYAYSLRELIKEEVDSDDDYDHPLKGFRIVVDAGNGAGGFYATDVLEALGADIRGSQFLEPDGMFPNHVPNPENAEAMASISAAVLKNNADLGVIFDTDVDRGGAVDAKGNEINRNKLAALASAIALEGNEGGTIVTDSVTSGGLKKFIEETLGGKHLRFKRGYKNVINEAVAQNEKGINCPLAIETSGHAALRENYFLDDGAYLVTKIIIKMAQLRKEGKRLETLIEQLEEPIESKEIRIKITEKDFRKYGEKVIANLFEYAEKQKTFIVAEDNHEGIRVSFNKTNGNGWFLLRLSVHDPIMPLNIESDSKGGVEKIYKKILPFLESCEGLETYKKPAVKKTAAKSEVTVEEKTETKSVTKKTTTKKTTAAKAEVTAEETTETKPAAKKTTAKKTTAAKAEAAAEEKTETKPAAKKTTTKKTTSAKAETAAKEKAKTTATVKKTAKKEEK